MDLGKEFGKLSLGGIDNTLKNIKIHSDVLDTTRYDYFDRVIEAYDGTRVPKECLAVAYAYMYKGAEYRPEAIRYFERYLTKPVKVPGYRGIYIDLGKLYEAEYDFANAEKYYKLFTQRNKGNTLGYTLLANLYAKIDIDKAVDFVYNVLLSDYAKTDLFKNHMQIKYDELLKKQAEGYKYQPRKEEYLHNEALDKVKDDLVANKEYNARKNKSRVIFALIVIFILYAATQCSKRPDSDIPEEVNITTTVEPMTEPESESMDMQDKTDDINESIDEIKNGAPVTVLFYYV